MITERFNFYGFTVDVSSAHASSVEEVRRDFSYFRVPTEGKHAQVQVQMHFVPPPYAELPPLSASFLTPRNVCFRNNKITYIDYFGKGLAVFERKEKRCVVYGTDPDLMHEITFLCILSAVGQYLDSQGIHRVHALGVSYQNCGIILLFPSGGGKSTIALELLRQPGFFLLGEDTPLIDRYGRILPFPLRLGVRPEQDTGIPPKYLRTMRRMEFDPKTLIDIEYFDGRLGAITEPRFILVGERNLGEISEIVPLGRIWAFKALFKYMVVGLGIYQGLEFLLERGLWDILGKGGVITSRLYNSLRLLSRSSTYRFILGRSKEKNCQTFLEFIHRMCR
jgi:hypothetical protein